MFFYDFNTKYFFIMFMYYLLLLSCYVYLQNRYIDYAHNNEQNKITKLK